MEWNGLSKQMKHVQIQQKQRVGHLITNIANKHVRPTSSDDGVSLRINVYSVFIVNLSPLLQFHGLRLLHNFVFRFCCLLLLRYKTQFTGRGNRGRGREHRADSGWTGCSTLCHSCAHCGAPGSRTLHAALGTTQRRTTTELPQRTSQEPVVCLHLPVPIVGWLNCFFKNQRLKISR